MALPVGSFHSSDNCPGTFVALPVGVLNLAAGGSESAGIKYDQGKPPLHLVSPDVLLELAALLGKGAAKYGARNWEEGLDYSRMYDALLRHLLAWFSGEEFDEEGNRHSIALVCNAMFIAAHDLRQHLHKFDDRGQHSG